MTFDPVIAVLLIPAGATMLLAALPGYRLTARINVLAALASFIVAFSLFFHRPGQGQYFHVDDLNNVFIVLTTFVGFTTSVPQGQAAFWPCSIAFGGSFRS
jgi:hydrogenase-4 component F